MHRAVNNHIRGTDQFIYWVIFQNVTLAKALWLIFPGNQPLPVVGVSSSKDNPPERLLFDHRLPFVVDQSWLGSDRHGRKGMFTDRFSHSESHFCPDSSTSV